MSPATLGRHGSLTRSTVGSVRVRLVGRLEHRRSRPLPDRPPTGPASAVMLPTNPLERRADRRRHPGEAAGRDEQDGDAERGDGDRQEQAEGQGDARAALDLVVGGETGRGRRAGRVAGPRRERARRGWAGPDLGRSPATPCRHGADCRMPRAGRRWPRRPRRVGVAAAVRSVVVLRVRRAGKKSPVVRRIRGIGCRHEIPSATARPGRPAGRRSASDPIARVSRPPTAPPSRLPGPEDRRSTSRAPRPAGSRGERWRPRRPDADARPAGDTRAAAVSRCARPSRRCHRRAAGSACRTCAGTSARTST